MAAKLTESQRRVMTWMNKGWKAYVTYGTQVEINGHPVCKTATMDSLEKIGLVEKLGAAAWTATEAGKQWGTPAEPAA